jgi:predicted nucleotidyltransferase
MGNHKKGSDIDLTILSDKIELATLYKIERELDDLLLPYTMDISVHRHILNPDLLDHIKKVGTTFYSVQT